MAGVRSKAMRRISLGAAALVLAMLGMLLPAAPLPAESAGRSTWIVELAAPPLAGYGGGLRAYAATSPRVTGGPLEPAGAAVRRYSAFLDERQDQVLRAAGAAAAPVMYRYRAAFGGFAARLTGAEAGRLAASPGVRSVTPDHRLEMLAASDPEPPDGPLERDGAAFLGLPSGLWDRLGGPDHAGEGVVVGVLDSGVHPEHPSFAADPGEGSERRYRGPAYPPPTGWRGACQTGARFVVTDCNNKLIGARFFVDGFGRDNLHEREFLSPRDASGHGSHTAATAAGNFGVVPVIGGHDFGGTRISGVAPRAHVAVYKVCWTGKESQDTSPTPGGCMASDTVAAVDAAVSDGVHVINYSLGSPSPSLAGPVDRAFLFAADAGVFVAAAAGNEGPEPATVGAPAGAPWVTTVAASTLARTFETSVVVTPGSDSSGRTLRLSGATLTGRLPATPLVDAVAVAAPGVAADRAELCVPGSLEPAAVTGKAVLCKRGENARVEKGEVVRDAGGAGMVLYNAAATEEVVADAHRLPAAHVALADGQAMKELLPGATVRFSGARQAKGPGDRLASFSSRGPQTLVPDLAKPDVAAPGVQILAASTPTPAGRAGKADGETFEIVSGTSMAAPHVAGAAALLRQLTPDRSPAALKSALMTTANPEVIKDDGAGPGGAPTEGASPAGPFEIGAGRIDPNRAADAGLVLEVTLPDFLRYLEGQDPDLVEGGLPPLAPADLNLPSVTLSRLAGTARTSRSFTGVDPEPSSWTASVEGMAGIEVAVDPPSFTVAPGQEQSVGLALRRGAAPFDAWVFGALALTETGGNGRSVRLPLSVRPVKVAAPDRIEIVTSDPGGSAPLTARAGFDGDLSALGWGLARSQVLDGLTIETWGRGQKVQRSPGVDVYDVLVAPGAQVLAAEITDADGGAPTTDLDLYLFFDREGDGFEDDEQVALSAGPDSAEAITLAEPEAGAYRFSVVGFATALPSTTYDFTTWLAADPSPDDPATPSTAPGLLATGDRRGVAAGEDIAFALEWSRLDTGGSFFGLVTFHDAAAPDPMAPIARTLVRITFTAAS